MPPRTPHEILGIAADATEADAVLAYKRLARVHHPDKTGGSTGKFQEIAKALADFTRAQPCKQCKGKGFVESRVGLAVLRENCPRCWGPQR